jgi:hypothetical protein
MKHKRRCFVRRCYPQKIYTNQKNALGLDKERFAVDNWKEIYVP